MLVALGFVPRRVLRRVLGRAMFCTEKPKTTLELSSKQFEFNKEQVDYYKMQVDYYKMQLKEIKENKENVKFIIDRHNRELKHVEVFMEV